jgi:hypothetical protein
MSSAFMSDSASMTTLCSVLAALGSAADEGVLRLAGRGLGLSVFLLGGTRLSVIWNNNEPRE